MRKSKQLDREIQEGLESKIEEDEAVDYSAPEWSDYFDWMDNKRSHFDDCLDDRLDDRMGKRDVVE